jgi:hypothetical protein
VGVAMILAFYKIIAHYKYIALKITIKLKFFQGFKGPLNKDFYTVKARPAFQSFIREAHPFELNLILAKWTSKYGKSPVFILVWSENLYFYEDICPNSSRF